MTKFFSEFNRNYKATDARNIIKLKQDQHQENHTKVHHAKFWKLVTRRKYRSSQSVEWGKEHITHCYGLNMSSSNSCYSSSPQCLKMWLYKKLGHLRESLKLNEVKLMGPNAVWLVSLQEEETWTQKSKSGMWTHRGKTMQGHSEKVAICKPRKCPEKKPACLHVDCGCLIARTVKNKLLV